MIKFLRLMIRGVFVAVVLITSLVESRAAEAQQIAITFDDLPAHSSLPQGESRLEIATTIMNALREAGLPPTFGFVNGLQVEREPANAAVLDSWRAAGYPLGNHGWSHMNLNDHPLSDFEADITRNEPTIENRMQGQDWHWFRFPFLAEGNTDEKRADVRKFLAQHGYKIAGVTMSFGDYLWNEPYARCIAKSDFKTIESMEASYLAAAKEELEYSRSLSHLLYNRDIPYVLLMHIGAFDARMLPRLLKMYKSEGVTFITLTEAEKDPFYSEDTDLNLPPAADTLKGMMSARHLPFPPHSFITPQMDGLCR
jgi:peptidoglycan-N-acetylglucosamine deacetylase